MNILLIGEWYSENLGDGVICETVEKVLLEEFSGKNIKIYRVDISGNKGWRDENQNLIKENTRKESYVVKIRKFIYYNFLVKITPKKYLSDVYRVGNILNILDEYRDLDIDGAVFAGGQMFMDYFVWPIYFIVQFLSKHNIPISFNCCGVGKNYSKLRRFVLRKSLNKKNIKSITVRDNLDYFKKEYMKRKDIEVEQVYDGAFALGKLSENKFKKATNIVGLGVMCPYQLKNNGLKFSPEQYIYFWKDVIRSLDEEDIKWQIFTNGSNQDYSFAKRIINDLNINDSNKLAIRPTRPKELINLISKYETIISFRLHSHIISYSLGKTTYGIIWDEKVREFSKTINCTEHFSYLENDNEKLILNFIKSISNEVDGTQNRNKILNEVKNSITKSVYSFLNYDVKGVI